METEAETCEFRWMVDDVAVKCMAPPLIDIRWHWRGRGECVGSMCAEHWLIGCQQLADDPEVDPATIEVMRRA